MQKPACRCMVWISSTPKPNMGHVNHAFHGRSMPQWPKLSMATMHALFAENTFGGWPCSVAMFHEESGLELISVSQFTPAVFEGDPLAAVHIEPTTATTYCVQVAASVTVGSCHPKHPPRSRNSGNNPGSYDILL